MKDLSKITVELSIDEKIRTSTSIALWIQEKYFTEFKIVLKIDELIFLFHSLYFNSYRFPPLDHNKKIKKAFSRNKIESVKDIDDILEKFKINFPRNFDEDDILSNIIKRNEHIFPSVTDRVIFFNSKIYGGFSKKIGNKIGIVFLADQLINQYINDNKNKSDDKTNNEYSVLLKGLIGNLTSEKYFNTKIRNYIAHSGEEIIDHSKMGLYYTPSHIIDIIKNSFGPLKGKKVYGSGKGKPGYENLAFSDSSEFSTNFSKFGGRNHNHPLFSEFVLFFFSSIDYLIARYVQQINDYEKLRSNFNVSTKPLTLDEILKKTKKDLVYFEVSDLNKIATGIDNPSLFDTFKLDLHKKNTLDLNEILNDKGSLFIYGFENQLLRRLTFLNELINQKLIKAIVQLLGDRKVTTARHLLIEITLNPNESINFVYASDLIGLEKEHIENAKKIGGFLKNQNDNFRENNNEDIFIEYRNRHIPYSKIKEVSDLDPSRYSYKIDSKNLIQLKDILERVQSEKQSLLTDDENYQIIHPELESLSDIENFKSTKLSFEKNKKINWTTENVKPNFIYKNLVRILPNTIVLLKKAGTNLRFGFFNPSDISKKYYINSSIGSNRFEFFKLTSKEILPEFLFIEMSKKYFRNMLQRMSVGVVPRIASNSFLNSSILLKTKIDQKEQIGDYYRVSNNIKSFKNKGRAFERSNIHIINRIEHRLDPKIGNFKSYLNRLIKEIDAGSTDKQKQLKYLNILKETVNSMESLIEQSGKEIKNPDKIELEKISINSLIEVIKNIDSNQYVFDIELEQFESSKEEDLDTAYSNLYILDYKVEFYDTIEEFEKDYYKIPDPDKDDHNWDMAAKKEIYEFLDEAQILSNKSLFTEMVDIILTNTNIHAFNEIKKENQVLKIGIDLSIEINDAEQPEYYFVLSFSNNGVKLPKKYEKKHFIQSGKESEKGTGSGGYYLNDIATSFENPDWEFITDSEEISDNFAPALTYKFKFKIYEG